MLVTEVKRDLEDLVVQSVDVPFRLDSSSDAGFVLEDAEGNQFCVSVGGGYKPCENPNHGYFITNGIRSSCAIWNGR